MMIKSIMHDDVCLGDRIICDGAEAWVIDIIDHPPGAHDSSPIYNHLMAREFVTNRGSRWRGYAVENRNDK